MAALRQTVSGGARVAIAASASPCRRTRPAARSAWPAGTTGWSCGYASRAAGWPARTTPPTGTRKPTTRKPTTPSPFGCDPGHGRGGATSITASSEIGARSGAAREPIARDDESGTTLGQRQRGLADVLAGRGPPEMQLLGQGDEIAQLPKLHPRHPRSVLAMESRHRQASAVAGRYNRP